MYFRKQIELAQKWLCIDTKNSKFENQLREVTWKIFYRFTFKNQSTEPIAEWSRKDKGGESSSYCLGPKGQSRGWLPMQLVMWQSLPNEVHLLANAPLGTQISFLFRWWVSQSPTFLKRRYFLLNRLRVESISDTWTRAVFESKESAGCLSNESTRYLWGSPA